LYPLIGKMLASALTVTTPINKSQLINVFIKAS
jgi:hypothetical protein